MIIYKVVNIVSRVWTESMGQCTALFFSLEVTEWQCDSDGGLCAGLSGDNRHLLRGVLPHGPDMSGA